MVLLADNGLINSLVKHWGLPLTASSSCYNELGYWSATVHIICRSWCLTLSGALQNIPPDLELASRKSLGASFIQAFWRIVFPLSASGRVRRLSARLDARRQLLRDPVLLAASGDHTAAARVRPPSTCPTGRERRSGGDPVRRLARVHRAVLQADEPSHAGALAVSAVDAERPADTADRVPLGRTRPMRRRRLACAAFLALITLLYVFLIAPIVIVVVASLNAGRSWSSARGLVAAVVRQVHEQRTVCPLVHFSLRLAALTTVITTVHRNGAALYVIRHARRNNALRMLTVALLQLPGIMTSLALLIFYYAIGPRGVRATSASSSAMCRVHATSS